MSNMLWLVLVILVILPLSVFFVAKALAMYNSADGERYRKRRMQGPFAPLSAEDIAEDEARAEALHSKRRSRAS